MLNRFYHMAEGFTGLPAERTAMAGGIAVAHVVEGGLSGSSTRSAERVAQLMKHLYSAGGNYPFCLVLRGGDVVTLARQVLLLVFHPCYVVAEKGRPLFVEGVTEEALRVFREQRIEVELIAMGEAKMLDVRGSDPAGEYYRYCLSAYNPEDVFLLTGGDLAGWAGELDRVDRELAKNHALIHRLAIERFAAGEEAARQRREIGRLREERRIMEELLELGKKHDEVSYILRFYRNEYEILPLWYKRFGHIIKVIQGKRSFRSLFDKSVKKYKD